MATAGVRSIKGVHPQYVSPSTQSITIAISGPTPVNETVNLTPTSTGCASSLASTVCTLSITGLSAGHYAATLTTYDQPAGAGKVLSAAQALTFAIAAGQNNQVSLTLSGVPVRTVMLPVDPSITVQNGSVVYDLYGLAARTFLVASLDADGNIIVGPGAPLFAISAPSGTLTGVTTIPSTTTVSEKRRQSNCVGKGNRRNQCYGGADTRETLRPLRA